MGKKPSSTQEGRSPEAREKTKAGGAFDPQSLVGETLDGRYEIEKPIGRGGMGVVYLAHQRALGRKVVVKVLPPSFVGDKEASARFEREAQGMSRLQHPHVVSIYDFGYRDDQAYIVMEYVEGITLRELIKSDREMDLAVFGAIGLQILEGISEAHSLGLVHRDIKPSNIMLTERRGEQTYVKILDFGLAKLVKGARDVTKEQNLVGSVAFLAPEQIMGNVTDERVDVYALGVLFYYMLSGHKPFCGDDDVAVLYQHVHNDPARLEKVLVPDHDIPQSIIDLIHRALSKDPADRPHNAGQFLDEFGACLDGTDIASPHVSGEFNAVSRVTRLSSLSPDDPSGKLTRERRETPIHHVPADATPTNPGLVAMGNEPSSGQVTWVSGEHLIKVEKQNRLRNILLGVLGALLVGGAGIFFYLRQADVPDEAEVRADLGQVAELIERGKLGQAESSLEMLERDLEHHPDLRTDFVATQDRLEIARLMATGAFHEEEGDVEQAIAAYKKVLGRNRSHDEARERLAALRSENDHSDAVDAAPKADSRRGPEEANGSRAPQKRPPAGGAQASSRASDTRPKGDRTAKRSRTERRVDQRDEQAAPTPAARSHEPESTDEEEAISADEGRLLPADDSASASDEPLSDLLPADAPDSSDDLLLD